jgi:hypothetical protein
MAHQGLGTERYALHRAIHQRDMVWTYLYTFALRLAIGHDLTQVLVAVVARVAH